MGEFTIYILKSSIAVAIFFLFYNLLLSRETLHKFNRFLLIAILFLSFVLPLINLSSIFNDSIENNALNNSNLFNDPGAFKSINTTVPIWAKSIVVLYFIGILAALLFLSLSFIKMLRIIQSSKIVSKEEWGTIYITEKRIAPFSWMRCFVINQEDFESEGDLITAHEKSHILHKHSFDILVSQLALIFQWFNPAIYLLKQQLQAIHEYEADQAVIDTGVDAKKYQLLLIKKAVGQRLFSLANSFNHGKLKKRITMMVTKKSNKSAATKVLFILPIAALLLTAFSSNKLFAAVESISKVALNDFSSNNSTLTVPVDTIKIQKGNSVIKIVSNSGDPIMDTLIIIKSKDVKDKKSVKKGSKIFITSKDSIETTSPDGKKIIMVNVTEKSFVGKGDTSSIVIRGVAKVAQKDKPIYIVDGVKITDDQINLIKPENIVKIEVLKDQKAIDLYGKEGEKGVIIITTKEKK